MNPAQVAMQIEPLRKLLEARQQLSNLLTYMDGKNGAEQLIGDLLNDPALLQAPRVRQLNAQVIDC